MGQNVDHGFLEDVLGIYVDLGFLVMTTIPNTLA